MRAVILAGGKGTRLKPYTSSIPKPLVPLGGKTSIIEVIIRQLSKNGFKHITLAVNHLSHLIKNSLGDGKKFGIKIDYSSEDKVLGTVGPLTNIENLPEDFLLSLIPKNCFSFNPKIFAMFSIISDSDWLTSPSDSAI